jgi:hypothetical protein
MSSQAGILLARAINFGLQRSKPVGGEWHGEE